MYTPLMKVTMSLTLVQICIEHSLIACNMDNLVEMVRFFTTLILNADESTLL